MQFFLKLINKILNPRDLIMQGYDSYKAYQAHQELIDLSKELKIEITEDYYVMVGSFGAYDHEAKKILLASSNRVFGKIGSFYLLVLAHEMFHAKECKKRDELKDYKARQIMSNLIVEIKANFHKAYDEKRKCELLEDFSQVLINIKNTHLRQEEAKVLEEISADNYALSILKKHDLVVNYKIKNLLNFRTEMFIRKNYVDLNFEDDFKTFEDKTLSSLLALVKEYNRVIDLDV